MNCQMEKPSSNTGNTKASNVLGMKMIRKMMVKNDISKLGIYTATTLRVKLLSVRISNEAKMATNNQVYCLNNLEIKTQ